VTKEIKGENATAIVAVWEQLLIYEI